MTKILFITIFVITLFGNIFFAIRYKEQTKLNGEIVRFNKEIQDKSVFKVKNIIKNICQEQNNTFLREDSFNNKILIRIPKGVCVPCLKDFQCEINKLYDSIPNKDIYIITSLQNSRKVKEFQALVKYKVINIPDLYISFFCENENYPYFLLSSGNKFKFPMTGYINEEIASFYIKTLLFEYNQAR